MLNILLTYLPFRWNNKTAENRNHATKMSDSKPKDSQTNPHVILKVSFIGFHIDAKVDGALGEDSSQSDRGLPDHSLTVTVRASRLLPKSSTMLITVKIQRRIFWCNKSFSNR